VGERSVTRPPDIVAAIVIAALVTFLVAAWPKDL